METRKCPKCGRKLRYRISVSDYTCDKCEADFIFHDPFPPNEYTHQSALILLAPDEAIDFDPDTNRAKS